VRRRVFLRNAAAGLGAMAYQPQASDAFQGQASPADRYVPPDWLRYSRCIYFEGYAPPAFPHPKNFNAKVLVEQCLELGADTLRFQPVGLRALYPEFRS
jgi:hypothetical protein